MFRFLLLGLAGGLASGCFSMEATYPEEWAAPMPMPGNACPDIDGIFANSGESRAPDGASGETLAGARSLAHILNGGTGVDALALWNKLGETTVHAEGDPNVAVRLRVADGQMQVTAWHADGDGRSLVLPVRSECRDGLLELESDWDADFELISPAAPEFSRKSLAFARTEDGALLLHERKTASMTFLWMPVFGYTETAWTRFLSTSAPTPAQATAVAAAEESP